jgi:large subunit ribosomal protein L25
MARKELAVTPREVLGKKVARLRRSGFLPANIYGHGLDSVSVQVETEALEKTLRAATVNEVIDITVAGEGAARPVVIHKIQRHPTNSGMLHADFYQVSLREKMRADVPLVIVGRSEAVETYKGTLVSALEALHIEALPLDIPAHIEVDITPLEELEAAVHVRDLPIPGNITVLNEPDAMVVKVASPSVLEEEEEAAAAEEEHEPPEGAGADEAPPSGRTAQQPVAEAGESGA